MITFTQNSSLWAIRDSSITKRNMSKPTMKSIRV